MKNYNSIIEFTNHNHPGGSLFDAVDEQKNYCEAAVKAGYKYFVVSDHGSFSAMQHCIDYVKKKSLDLKIVYGVEAYVEIPGINIADKVAHVILIAKNEEGKHLIDKLNSHAEFLKNGAPIISWKQFSTTSFNNNVIATSACISGAPATWLLINDTYEKRIKKYKAKLNDEKYVDPDSKEAVAYFNEVKKLETEVSDLQAIKNSKVLETKLKASNKLARDLKAKEMMDELEAEKNKAIKITQEIEKNKEALSAAKSQLKELKSSDIMQKIMDI